MSYSCVTMPPRVFVNLQPHVVESVLDTPFVLTSSTYFLIWSLVTPSLKTTMKATEGGDQRRTPIVQRVRWFTWSVGRHGGGLRSLSLGDCCACSNLNSWIEAPCGLVLTGFLHCPMTHPLLLQGDRLSPSVGKG